MIVLAGLAAGVILGALVGIGGARRRLSHTPPRRRTRR